ncbi:unnamed protein product [Gongylonema pulchrum]|uniref:GRIP domain-containing protein n=2 Tax=Gongylonema pulchrum TaxID=637853 RepID=A0A183DY71_9BILA|nr:unnamed protein product [Gongylonema pulchrum]
MKRFYRADGLQNALEEKEREIKELREEISRITQVAEEEKLMCQRALEEMNAKLAEFEKSPKQEDIDALDATIESLRNEISEKDKCIENITKSKNDAEQSLNEHSQWLLDANSRIADLENNEKDKDKRIKALHDEIEQLSGKVVLDLKAALEAVQRNEKLEMPVEELVAKLNDAERALAESPKLNDFLSLKAENDDLRKKLHEKQACLEDLEKEKNDAQWRLGEHIQWLKDANDRANWLDGFVHDKDRSISELQQENEQLRLELASAPKLEDVGLINLEASSRDKDDIIDGLRRELEALRADDAAQLRQKIDELERVRAEKSAIEARENDRFQDDDRMRCLEHQVNDLNRAVLEKDECIARLEKERNDKEWSLGEHRQWLSDANNRADELAAKLRKAEDELSRLEHTEEPDEAEKCKVLDQDETVAHLKSELEQKTADLDNIARERSEAEWYLGEERQRLRDANLRNEELLKCLNGKDEALNSLQQINTELYAKLTELEQKVADGMQLPVGAAEFAEKARNSKLEETLQTKETILNSLKKEAKTSMLILEQNIGVENLEEEFRKVYFLLIFCWWS